MIISNDLSNLESLKENKFSILKINRIFNNLEGYFGIIESNKKKYLIYRYYNINDNLKSHLFKNKTYICNFENINNEKINCNLIKSYNFYFASHNFGLFYDKNNNILGIGGICFDTQAIFKYNKKVIDKDEIRVRNNLFEITKNDKNTISIKRNNLRRDTNIIKLLSPRLLLESNANRINYFKFNNNFLNCQRLDNIYIDPTGLNYSITDRRNGYLENDSSTCIFYWKKKEKYYIYVRSNTGNCLRFIQYSTSKDLIKYNDFELINFNDEYKYNFRHSDNYYNCNIFPSHQEQLITGLFVRTNYINDFEKISDTQNEPSNLLIGPSDLLIGISDDGKNFVINKKIRLSDYYYLWNTVLCDYSKLSEKNNEIYLHRLNYYKNSLKQTINNYEKFDIKSDILNLEKNIFLKKYNICYYEYDYIYNIVLSSKSKNKEEIKKEIKTNTNAILVKINYNFDDEFFIQNNTKNNLIYSFQNKMYYDTENLFVKSNCNKFAIVFLDENRKKIKRFSNQQFEEKNGFFYIPKISINTFYVQLILEPNTKINFIYGISPIKQHLFKNIKIKYFESDEFEKISILDLNNKLPDNKIPAYIFKEKIINLNYTITKIEERKIISDVLNLLLSNEESKQIYKLKIDEITFKHFVYDIILF